MERLAPLLYGSSFCWLLIYKLLHKRHDCGALLCDDYRDPPWTQFERSSQVSYPFGERVVISYGHNGFGNQLFQHTLAYFTAKTLNASLYIAEIPPNIYRHNKPENTGEGSAVMDSLVPNAFKYYFLDDSSPHKVLCENENFTFAVRPVDGRTRSAVEFNTQLNSILTDSNPRCLKLLGYFQSDEFCVSATKALWVPALLSTTPSMSELFHPKDISIYFRCTSHYFSNDVSYYRHILNHTEYHHIRLFLGPACGLSPPIKFLMEEKNATVWKSGNETDAIGRFMFDFIGLMSSPRLILPISTWAFWAGIFSNATEIHVPAGNSHRFMGPNQPQYIYHDQKKHSYFGKADSTTKSFADLKYKYIYES